jgi:hypothetical protein
MTRDASKARTDRLRHLVDELLSRDADAHAEAVARLADEGDERVIPHLLEVLVVDAIGNDWSRFGFPEVLRDRDPPRYLELPEVSWPGARDALASLSEPDFDSDHAWVEWESWYSQQEIEPLAGFDKWKLRLYHSYLPPVGGLLDCEPRNFDLQAVRWGNCDRSFLAALNAPDFVSGDAVDDSDEGAGGNSSGSTRYLSAEDHIFGFVLEGVAYAVPRWVLFPHELMNVELGGLPVSLTYCTLCNAPILYDRRIDGDVLTFGSTGLLASGNKVMYDEETESLWDQHAGTPMGGQYQASHPGLFLDQFAVTQTDWESWKAEYPDTLVLDVDTGYGYDYSYYDGNIGFFRHYWNEESVVQPGVRTTDDGDLPEKASVYGITEGSTAWVIPETELAEDDVLVGTVAGRQVVALRDATGDVAVYDAPSTQLDRRGDGLIDENGRTWTVTRSEIRGPDGSAHDRIAGRHGLWFAFRTHYDETHVLR